MNWSECKGTRTHWVTSDGERVHVKHLETSHLANIINYLRRKRMQDTGSPSIKEVDIWLFEHLHTFPRLVEEAQRRLIWHPLDMLSHVAPLDPRRAYRGEVNEVQGDLYAEVARELGVSRDEVKRRVHSMNYGWTKEGLRNLLRSLYPEVKAAGGDNSLHHAMQDLQRRVLLDRKDWEDTISRRTDAIYKTINSVVEKHNQLAEQVAQVVDVVTTDAVRKAKKTKKKSTTRKRTKR